MGLPFDPTIPLLAIQPKRPETLIRKNISSPVFTAALFTVAKIWRQPECPSVDEWGKQLRDICTVEYHSAMEKKDLLSFATAGMDLESIVVSEMSQPEKDKYHVTSLIRGI